MSAKVPSIVVLYQFLPPDDVVSAVLFGELCAGLVERGWEVCAYPSIRSRREPSLRFAPREQWQGVSIRRIWRPNFPQSSGWGRLLNAAWMIARWSLLSLTLRPSPDVLLIGSDPVLSLVAARFCGLFTPKVKVAHWCFDLYPEAAIAEGILPPRGLLTRALRRILAPAYRRCSLIADLGPCMRALLLRYPTTADRATIVPWALEEPSGPLPIAQAERASLFGDASLALLYSGSFGRAHTYDEILKLAEWIYPHGGRLTFSVRGNREAELRHAAQERKADVRFVPFAPVDKLDDRLACADIHVVTLRPEWTGTVIPSKFFGALAAGRPVLFSGKAESSIAIWIREFQVGWVLTNANLPEIASRLLAYAASASEIEAMQQRCFTVYRSQFSRSKQVDAWDRGLRSLLDGS